MTTKKHLRINFICTTLLLCAALFGNAYANELNYRFASPEAQKALINELEHQNIRYSIGDAGAVRYSLNDKKQVDNILKNIVSNVIGTGTAVSYEKEEYYSIFIKKMKQNNIPYEIKILDGKKWITWQLKHDSKVEVIQQEVLVLIASMPE